MSFFNFSSANLIIHWFFFLFKVQHGKLHLLPKSVIIICKIPFPYLKKRNYFKLDFILYEKKSVELFEKRWIS